MVSMPLSPTGKTSSERGRLVKSAAEDSITRRHGTADLHRSTRTEVPMGPRQLERVRLGRKVTCFASSAVVEILNDQRQPHTVRKDRQIPRSKEERRHVRETIARIGGHVVDRKTGALVKVKRIHDDDDDDDDD